VSSIELNLPPAESRQPPARAGWATDILVTVKLYVCWGTFQTVRPGGHPCHNAHKALREAGYDPEVVRVHGLGIGPVKWMTEGRREVKELTGQPVVPVLITDGGEAITESKRIAEWARTHPAAEQASAA
jgi:Glutathione S-transferase, N-terminal domain